MAKAKDKPVKGWQEEKYYHQRVYHYIYGTFSLCGSLGFYQGDLVPDDPSKKLERREANR